MNRRVFFRVFSGVPVTALVDRATAPRPDAFSYHGWRVRWSGWRHSPNQIVQMGFWSAHRHPNDQSPYATTLGVVSSVPELGEINWTRLDHHVPYNPAIHTEIQFEAAKEWARQRLLAALDRVADR
jgi:hypothetical protein